MRRVGENAMRELYLSWEDAVARANERYGAVLDRYRSGKYPKHERFSDEFFHAQGDLMEAMSLVAEMRGETGRLRRELREGWNEAREAFLALSGSDTRGTSPRRRVRAFPRPP